MTFNFNNSTYIDGMMFVPVTYPYNYPDALLIENLRVDQLISYLQKKELTKAFIQGFSEFDFIRGCQSLEHIAIELRLPFSELSKLMSKSKVPYDLSCLYDLPRLKSVDLREDERFGARASCKIDLTKIPLLEMFVGDYRHTSNIGGARTLKTLRLHHFDGKNLTELQNLTALDTMHLSFSKIRSLDGTENMESLQCLYLHRNRELRDIEALCRAGRNLRVLSICDCPNIADFSVIGQLEGLVRLNLGGSNSIPSLDFIRKMPNLKILGFDVNVLDGNLSPCQSLQWVYSAKNRKHYNLKNSDLPKNDIIVGNENIELWRRLE